MTNAIKQTLIAAGATIVVALIGLWATTHSHANSRPVASLRVTCVAMTTPGQFMVDARGSYDPDGDPIDVFVEVDNQRLAGNALLRTLTLTPGQVVKVVVTDSHHSTDATECVISW